MQSGKSAGEWSERSEHWIAHAQTLAGTRRMRHRRRDPLILCGQGISLRIDKCTLLAADGFTHPDQTRKTYRFFKGDLDLPPRIVLIDASGSVSLDVLHWMAEQDVALVSVDWRGSPIAVLSPSGYAADRKKLLWQIEARADNGKRMAFSYSLITRKIAASIPTLKSVVAVSVRRDRAIERAETTLATLKASPPSDMTELRAAEAICAGSYFGSWRDMPLNWKATARFPIPDDWWTYKGRGSLANGIKNEKMNASHPMNALLNYAYGVLQSQLHVKAVADGYDPTFGIMHHGKRGSPAYIFDIMEPERPRVDKLILRFIADQTFSGADFPIRENGVCRLSPQLARTVAAMVATIG